MKINIIVFLFCLIKQLFADFKFGQITFNQADEIGAAIFIPNQPRAIIVTTTRYPEYGFFLGLYDLDSCSMIAPNGSCQPDLLAGYYERELNVRPDPKPQVIWYGGVDNKFVLSGYIRKEAATCMIKQYTVGVNYDEITDNGNTIYCTGENPAANLYPEKQIYYTEALDMLYIKDYDIITSMWVIRTYDLANNAFNANTHTWADEKYFLTNDQRTGVANKYYAYYEYDSTIGGAQTIFIKDIDQVKTNNYFTVTLVVDHVQEAVMFKTPSQLMAVIHNNYAIVLYNYQIDQPVHYIYFEVYFPLLESFKSVYGPNGDEMLQVASKVGEDRFIKWIIVDTTDNDEEDLVMWRGHTMKLNDPYDYNFQQAVAYDAAQNYLSHMSSEQVYSFYYVDDCQHGYQTGYAGQCSDANCAVGCLSCDAATCIICQDGYTFDSTYTCQPSASYGQTADEDYVGVYIGFDGPGEYIQDTSTLEDLLVSFDYTNLRMYAFDIETEVLTITDLTAFIAFDVMDFVFLPTNQQLLCVEDEGASGYNMVRRTFATLGTTNPINIYRTDLPINIVAATLLDGATNYQHIIYMLDDGSTQDFYILDVDTGNQSQYSIGFNNLDTTNTVQIFFFAQLSWGNILLVQDLNFFTHVFECYANKPGGPPTCDPEAYSFDALAQVRFVHIDNTDNFVVYSVGDINMRVVRIGTGARTTLCNFAAPFGVTSGIYMLLTTTVSYDIFVTLNYDGTVSVFEFNAAFTTATLVRTIYGFKYWNRDLTAGSNYVGDNNVFLGWQSDAEQMKLGIKTYENYQTINLCGENGIHNDATANKCDLCHNYCLRCTVAADNTACDVCSVGYYKYFSATTCDTACPIVGEYADANWRECRPCNFQCQTCTASADNCLTCRAGNRLTPPNCACPANTYEDYTSANCPECDNINTPPSCVTCVEDYDGTGLCTVCAANMVNNDNDNLCECDVGDYTHPLAFTQYCTTCFTAPYQAQLADDMRTVTVEFYTAIDFPTFNDPYYELSYDDWTYELCVFVLDAATLAECGEVPLCRRSVSQTAFEIFYGYMPTQIAGGNGILGFTTNSIHRPTCGANDFFNWFPEDALIDAVSPNSPTGTLVGPSYVHVCEDFDIQLMQAQDDGLRQLTNIVWSSTSTETSITNLMTYYTNLGTLYVTIPALTLNTGTSYYFQVYFENYQGQAGTESITITTYAAEEGPYIRMDYENYPRYFLDEPITFNAELNYIQCDSNAGEITYVEDQPFYTIWQIIDSTSVASDLETVTANYQQFISWEYDPWDLATYDGYQIRLKATSNGVQAVQTRPFDVVEYPYLMCYIAGGSRIESVNNDLLIEANVLNFDVTDALQNSGVTYNWRCIDVMQYNNCVDNTGAVLTFANSASLTIPANTLEPYQTYRFRLDASITTPSIKQCYYIVYITILDVEQTLQLIDFPEHIQAGSVNLNDVFAVTVDLDGFLNYDEPIYNFAFIYNDQIIANQTVKYETFNIRLMDYFDSVIVSDPYIQLRISVQSPYEYQPNMMSLRLYLNYPPQNGVLAVSDAISGTALSTSYTFQTYGWTDYNFDYSYRFSYYLTRDYYDEEVERGYNPLMSEMNIICDYSFRSVCSSYLPLPIQDDSDGNYYAVIMVQARDTLGGISNVTQAIQIQPSTKTRVNEIDTLDSLYRKVLFSQKEEKVKKLVQIAHQLRQIDEEGCSVCSGNGVCDAVSQQCQCETGYYMRDCSMEKSDYDTYSTFKMEVLGSLMDLREKQLQLGYEEQIVKAQYSLLDDKYLGVTFNQTFVESYINEMDTYINSKISGKIDEIVDNNYIYKAKYKFDIDIDSIHRILKHLYYQFDAFAYSLNNTSYYSSRRQLDSFTEFQRLKYYKQLVNLTRDCGYQLHRMTQPNDKIYVFEGKMFNDKMTVMSTKYILEQILDHDIETDVINFSQTGPDIEGDGNVHVYDVMVQGYEVNPYRYEPTFPYPEQDTQCQDIDVFRQNTPEREISIEVKAKYEFDAINTENPDYNICISRQYNGVWLPPTWTSLRCNTTVLEDSSGDYNVFCTCFDLNPVSVVDDYMCNFSNCQYEEDDFRWYESLMLYTLIVFFLFFWYLLYKAYIYDKIYMYKVTLEIPDSEEEPESEEDEKDEKDRLKVGNVFEYIQGSRRGKIKRHKKRTAGDEGEDIVVEDRGGKTEVDADELEQEEVYNDVYFKQNVCWAIYKLHELLEIFFFYDPDCRRVFRVFFWYSKGMFMAGLIGTLLDKDLYLWYIVMYIGLYINIYDGLISIMKQLMRRPQFILKIIGLNLGIFSLIAALYMIIICNQWDNLADANDWAYIFLCLYFIDTMGWQPLLIFTKTVILNLAIGKGNRCARFIKWLFIFYEENIFFRNLLNQAKNVFG